MGRAAHLAPAEAGLVRRRTLVQIRPARASDVDRLTEIAHRAKRYWGYDEELIALWRDDLTVTADFVGSHPAGCAVEGAEVVGFYALSDEGEIFELEHMWVDPANIGRGTGAALFRHAVDTVRALGGSKLRIVSDPNAAGFYVAMGARRVGDGPSKPKGRSLPVFELEIA